MKKKFKETALGKFLKDKAPSILDMVGDVFTPAKVLSRLISSEPNISIEDKTEAQKLLQEYEIEAFKIEFQDRQSARKDGNQSLQKIMAYFSLIGFTLFLGATMWMSYEIMVNQLKINEFVIVTVSNGTGVFTGLLFTLKDFLYGGSVGVEGK